MFEHSLPPTLHSRYWSRIDEALRWVAYSRGVHVRLMGSYWNHTEPDMPHFLRSLAADNGTGSFRGIIETVRGGAQLNWVAHGRWL